MSMNCDQFQDRILELAYGELDEVTARSLRAHAENCTTCGEELKEIEEFRGVAAQVDTPSIPTHFDDDIMALARAKAKAMASGTADSPPVAERHRALSFIMRPQVGLAVAACLLLGVMWKTAYAPHETMFETADGAPFKDAAEKSTGAEEALPPQKKSLSATPIQMADGSVSDSEAAIREQAERALAEPGKYAPRVASAPAPRTNPTDRLELAAAAPPARAASAGMAKADEDPAVENEMARMKKSRSTAPAPMGSGDMVATLSEAPAAKEEAMEAPRAAKAPGASPDGFSIAMNQYRTGNCAAATSGFQQLLDAGALSGNREATALHTIARCERRTGRCGKALIPYEQLVRGYATYPGRAEALWEAAACHRRLGHKARARALLQELSTDPAWSAKANSELRTLD